MLRRRLLAAAGGAARPARRCAHTQQQPRRRRLPDATPTLGEFVQQQRRSAQEDAEPLPLGAAAGRSFRVETYGCQMNVSDTQVVGRILVDSGLREAPVGEEADIVLLNTCAIREKAEAKIWGRLQTLRSGGGGGGGASPGRTVGVLGCMAERLKERLLDAKDGADLVVGPDAYRDLPRLLALSAAPDDDPEAQRQAAINVLLSQDETYADIAPLRTDTNGLTAFVSIMRGCNNMCSYCIVPFTRGRERSRSLASIVAEVQELSAQGYKEVTLLGQNVNSYNDRAGLTPDEAEAKRHGRPAARALGGSAAQPPRTKTLPKGFSEIYKPQTLGTDFAALVDAVSAVDPEMRIRFTSPHPKDFPPQLVELIASRPNVCNSVHMPAQSGSSAVLSRMRRGYTRDAYLELVRSIRARIPGVAVSTDMISGFCGETEVDHAETLSLMQAVEFENAFCFAFSTREKTHAHRRLEDDVPQEVKRRRLNEVLEAYRRGRDRKNAAELGRLHCVLVEGTSRKSDERWQGRSCTNKTVVFDADGPVACGPGDYVIVRVEGVHASTLQGVAVETTTLAASAAKISALETAELSLPERREGEDSEPEWRVCLN